MITKWHKLLEKFATGSSEKVEENKNLKIATAVLFLEIAHADLNISEEEDKNMLDSIKKLFEISESHAVEIFEIAHEQRSERNDIWFFAKQIKENIDRPLKIKIVELLWELVYADGQKDKYEEALMRKIYKILGLSHGEMIQAKLKVEK